MDIYILDGLSGIIGIVQSYQSVIWNMQFYGRNDFQLVVPGTDYNISMLTKGRYLVRDADISSGEYRNVMVIRDVIYKYDVDCGWTLTLSGPGLKAIVGQRIVWSQTNLSGKVETGIRKIINANIISPSDSARKINNFVLDAAAGFTDTFEAQLAGDNIAEWLENVGQAYGIGWDVYISSGKYHFRLIKGTDRTYNQNAVAPVVFSPDFDNLASAEYTQEYTDYINAALIGGEGEGVEQVFATVGTASGLDRFEGYIDGSSVSSNGEIITLATYIKLLKEYGKESLTAAQENEKFTGEVLPDIQYHLGTDYFLGDLVQIALNSFRASSRVIEVIYAEDETGATLLPTFSEWEVNT